MATSTLQTLENALKTYYMGPITKQLDEQSGPIFAALDKGSRYIVGNKFKFPMQYGRSGGVGARAEDGNLPTPSARKYAQGEATAKNLYARFALTDKTIRTSKDSKASFVDQVSEMMENLVVDGNDMIRRNIVGSTSGQMAVVNGAVSAAKEITIDGGSIEAFYPGQVVDFGTASATAGQTITDVDYANSKIYVADNITLADDTVIYLAGNKDNEMTGLKDILTTGTTIYGIDRTNNKWFNPQVFDKTSGGATQDLDSMWIQQAIDAVETRTGEKPDFIACSYGVQRAYIDEQNTYKRNIEYMKVNGGYELVSYGKVPFSPEKYMDASTMYLLNTKNLYLGRLTDWDWMSEDGAIMHRIADKAAYEGSLVMYGELLCTKPASMAKIIGITEV